MRIRLLNRDFSPSLFILILTLFSFGLCVVLGFWQLDRADFKREIQDRYLQQLGEPFQFFILEPEVNPSFNYRKIQLTGQYRTEHIILVDNQLNKGQAGYHVLMPFFIDSSNAVLVDRGWVAADYDRSILPDINPPKDLQKVRGVVIIPSTEGFRMGEVEMSADWPQRIPYIDLSKIQQGVDYELLPYVVWQSPEMDDYYVRDWQPIWMPPEKSEAYALQWFSFAFVILVLFLGLNLKKPATGEVND